MRQVLWLRESLTVGGQQPALLAAYGMRAKSLKGGSGWHTASCTPSVVMEYFLLGRRYVLMLSFSPKERYLLTLGSQADYIEEDLVRAI